MPYGVVICTKCRQHAQIIELGISKTTRCQKCNANLNSKKLRVFFESGNLEEVISVRTQIQAQITEKRKKNNGINDFQVFGNEINEKSACLIDNRKVRKKRKTDELILTILQENDNCMKYDSLKKAAAELDIDEVEFDKILTKLTQAGEIYSPFDGLIRTV